MAAQAVAVASGGILSKLGGLKAILGKTPMLFAFFFVAFMLVSTLSQAVNHYYETNNLTDLFKGIGTAVLKPIVASDYTILQSVRAFNAGGMLWYQKIITWITIMGAASTIYFCFKWIFLKFVTMRFAEGMNPDASVYVEAIIIMFAFVSLYNTGHACNQYVFAGEGLWALFRNFPIIFEPILAIGEPILKAFNMLPDANLPIFT